jgi:hypothetical protein
MDIASGIPRLDAVVIALTFHLGHSACTGDLGGLVTIISAAHQIGLGSTGGEGEDCGKESDDFHRRETGLKLHSLSKQNLFILQVSAVLLSRCFGLFLLTLALPFAFRSRGFHSGIVFRHLSPHCGLPFFELAQQFLRLLRLTRR